MSRNSVTVTRIKPQTPVELRWARARQLRAEAAATSAPLLRDIKLRDARRLEGRADEPQTTINDDNNIDFAWVRYPATGDVRYIARKLA